MANQLLTISMITNRALPVLVNQCVTADKVNRQYDKEYGRKNFKIGGTCNIRVPPRYLGTFGPALNVEPSTENYMPVSILYQFHVDIQFNTINMLLDIDEFVPRFVHPACEAIGNRLDSDTGFWLMQNTGNRLGTPGTRVTSYLAFSDARAYLASEGMPKSRIPCAILAPFQQSAIADSLKGLFNPQASIDEFFEQGMIARKTAGADWFEDANIPIYNTGTLTGTPVLAGTSTAVGGSAILTSGWAQQGVFNLSGLTNTAAQCVVGDTITVAGVFPANPQNRVRYGANLKQFVVLPPGGYAQQTGVAVPGSPQFAPATLAAGTFNAATGQYTSSGSGTLAVTVADCLISGGQFQNVATNASFTGTPAVVINGGVASATASTENLYFDRDALALAMVDLPMPRTAVEASRSTDDELGVAIRVVTQYTINNDAEPTRMDIAYGFGSLYRGLACRVSG